LSSPSKTPNIALSWRGRCGRMNFMDDATDENANARRTIILVYVLMAVSVLLPLALWWLRR